MFQLDPTKIRVEILEKKSSSGGRATILYIHKLWVIIQSLIYQSLKLFGISSSCLWDFLFHLLNLSISILINLLSVYLFASKQIKYIYKKERKIENIPEEIGFNIGKSNWGLVKRIILYIQYLNSITASPRLVSWSFFRSWTLQLMSNMKGKILV